MTPLLALAVIAAGAVAAVARYLVSLSFARTPGFPWAVLTVNVAGSLIGGAVLALAERAEVSADLRLILLTGLCGGLTTFSTFSVETIELVRTGYTRIAVLSVAANLVLGVGAAAAAYLLLR
ncbi:fluoride efflux transporter CrcB [Conyzicola sp.]|uniref:fluoride efflux transporter CrcB n=1 Tax=Conyzicola sp. TaxID=1969404 RepID=UPI003989B7FB